jgi:cysteine desulfurase
MDHDPVDVYLTSMCCFMQTKAAVIKARQQVADLVGAQPEEVYFTSCGTEADNWAVSGVVLPAYASRQQQGTKVLPHVVTSAIEHPAILVCLDALQQKVGGCCPGCGSHGSM